MDMSKILSIIVPSYNMEAYLPECLGSLIIDDKELLQELDVIVVNDGSKDRTCEIAHEFEARHPGVFRVIDKSNGHYGSCINAALKVANGIFVKILDADDRYDKVALKRLLEFLCRDSVSSPDGEIDAVFTNAVRIDSDGRKTQHYCTTFVDNIDFNVGEMTYEEINSLWMHNVAYRTSLLKELDYRQTEGLPFTDQEWVFAPMSRVRKAASLSDELYLYLYGREGQTVEPGYYLKNFRVIREIAMQHVRDFSDLSAKATPGGGRFLRKRVLARANLVYRYHLLNFSEKQYREELDGLLEFDQLLKEALPDIYAKTGEVRFSRRISMSLVGAWRRKIAGRPFCDLILRKVLWPMAIAKSRLVAMASGTQNFYNMQ